MATMLAGAAENSERSKIDIHEGWPARHRVTKAQTL
jgi:hypothetical protein